MVYLAVFDHTPQPLTHRRRWPAAWLYRRFSGCSQPSYRLSGHSGKPHIYIDVKKWCAKPTISCSTHAVAGTLCSRSFINIIWQSECASNNRHISVQLCRNAMCCYAMCVNRRTPRNTIETKKKTKNKNHKTMSPLSKYQMSIFLLLLVCLNKKYDQYF